MKEAYGGIVSLVFIAIFLVVVMGILGLVVVYTKAFHMKDEIISTIEEYEGSGCCPEGAANCPTAAGGGLDTGCRHKIKEQAESLGYNPGTLHCPTGYTNAEGLYCYKVENANLAGSGTGNRKIFTVITQVDVSFPIIERIFGFRFFQVGGETEVIEFQYEE